MFEKEKETINMLMNIDNYFGEDRGRLGPTLIFLLVSAAPFICYVAVLSRVVPLKYALVFEVVWTVRMAFRILGKEDEKLRQYKKELGYEQDDEEKSDRLVYESANDLVRVSNVNEDGLIEYIDGRIAYVITGFTMTYMDDVSFTLDFETFIRQLRRYDYDIKCQLFVDEFRLQDDLEKMRVYVDKSIMYERMKFYERQDQYCRDNAGLYKIDIVVKGSKYDWKNLRNRLNEIVASDYSSVFIWACVCNKAQVNDVMSRDICANIDLNKMLIEKYKNDEFYGSEVLYYGDEVPDEYKPKRDMVGMESRRVVIRKEE